MRIQLHLLPEYCSSGIAVGCLTGMLTCPSAMSIWSGQLICQHFVYSSSLNQLSRMIFDTDAHDILAKIALLNHTDLPHGTLVSDSTVGCLEEEEYAALEYPPLLILAATSRKTADLNFRSGLFSTDHFSLRTTILLWVLYFGNVFSYYGIILLTSELSSGQSKCGSTIWQSKHLQDDDSLYINVFVTSLGVIRQSVF